MNNHYQQQEENYHNDENNNNNNNYNNSGDGGYSNVEFIGECRALYDYVGADQHELDFMAGDIINVIEKDNNSGWWTGELGGRTGLFPSNYVEE